MTTNYELVKTKASGDPYERELVLADKSVEIYSPLKVPQESLSLVQGQEKLILRNLNIDKLVTQLKLSADLAFLAYNGVVGEGTLAADVSDCQKGLEELCAEVVQALTKLQTQSAEALVFICDAFSYLVQVQEYLAFGILSSCSANAEKMATACSTVEGKVKALQTDVRAAVNSIEIRVAQVLKERETLSKCVNDLEANKAEQDAISKSLEASIGDLQQDYIEATTEEDVASERQLIAGIVGLVSGIVGTGLGVFISYETMGMAGPTRRKIENETNIDAGSEKKEGKTKGNIQSEGEKKSQGTKDQAAKKETPVKGVTSEQITKAVDKATSEEKVGDTSGADKSATAATGDKGTSSTEVSGGEGKGTGEGKGDSKGTTPGTEPDKKKSSIDKKRLAVAIARGVGKSSEVVQKQADVMAENAKTALGRAKIRRAMILDMKWEQESKNREALATVQQLTSLIKYKKTVESKWLSVQSSLETAKYSLNNLNNCLADARMFWRQMKLFCDGLSTADVIDRLQDKKSSDADVAERSAYYKSDVFVNSGIEYTTAWAALHYVCRQYQQAANEVRVMVNNNIGKSPTIAEAQGQINDLSSQIEAKVNKLQSDSDVRIRELAKQRNDILARDLGVQGVEL